MPLSDPDLTTIRRRTGASITEMPTAAINAIYDSATQGNSDLDRTTVYVLRELLGVLASLIDVTDPTLPSASKYSQRFDHVKDVLLPLWSGLAGMVLSPGFSLTATSTYTYRADSLQAEEPTYERSTTTLGWDE